MSNRSKVGKDFIKKDKEKAELRIKSVGSKKKKMGPPSKKELVDDARNSIQDREKRKKLFPNHDISQSINKKLGKPASQFSGKYSRYKDKESLYAQKRGRKKLDKEITKEATAKQVPKSMNKGGIVKMQGGGAATRGMNFNRGY